MEIINALVHMQQLVAPASVPLQAASASSSAAAAGVSPSLRLVAVQWYDATGLAECTVELDAARSELYAVGDRASILVFDTRTLHQTPRPPPLRTLRCAYIPDLHWQGVLEGVLQIRLDRQRQTLWIAVGAVKEPGLGMLVYLLDSRTGAELRIFDCEDWMSSQPEKHTFSSQGRVVCYQSLAVDTEQQRIFGGDERAVFVRSYESDKVGTFGNNFFMLSKEEGANPPPDYFANISSMVADEQSSRIFVADFKLCRISVWDTRTLKHLFTFGRPLTEAERLVTAGDTPPPAGAFRDLFDLHLLTCGSPPRRVLAVCDQSGGRHQLRLLLYSLEGEYLGYQLIEAPAGAEFWSAAPDPDSNELWLARQKFKPFDASESPIARSFAAAAEHELERSI